MEGGGTVQRINVGGREGGRKGERDLVVHRGDTGRYVGRKGVVVKGEGNTKC